MIEGTTLSEALQEVRRLTYERDEARSALNRLLQQWVDQPVDAVADIEDQAGRPLPWVNLP